MHAHLSVCAACGKRATLANVSALDDPYLAGRRANIRGKLIGDQAKRAIETCAPADFAKDMAYSTFTGCRHVICPNAQRRGGEQRGATHRFSVILVRRYPPVN